MPLKVNPGDIRTGPGKTVPEGGKDLVLTGPGASGPGPNIGQVGYIPPGATLAGARFGRSPDLKTEGHRYYDLATSCDSIGSIGGGSGGTPRFNLNGPLTVFPPFPAVFSFSFDGHWVAPVLGVMGGVWIFLRTRGVGGQTSVNLWKLPAGGGPAVQVNVGPMVTVFGDTNPIFFNTFNIQANYAPGDAFFVELTQRDVSGISVPADLTVELVP